MSPEEWMAKRGAAAPAASAPMSPEQWMASKGRNLAPAPQVDDGAKPPVTAMDVAGGVVEPAMTLASGMLSTPLAGLSGLIAGGTKAMGLTEAEPADVVRKVQSAATYQPRTRGGQAVTGAIAYPFEKLAEASRWAGEKALDATGSPVLATGVETALQSLPMLAGARVKLPGRGAARQALEAQKLAADKANALRAPENLIRQRAAEAGFKMPAPQAENTALNRLAGRLTGKTRAEQKASIANQDLTDAAVRRTIGLAEDEPISVEALNRLRADAGKVYEKLKQQPKPFQATQDLAASVNSIQQEAAALGRFKTTRDQATAMLEVADDLSAAEFSPADAVMLMKKLRSDSKSNATAASRQGGDVVLAAKARAQKIGAQALEKMVEDNLKASGQGELMAEFVAARKRIAQTHTVEKVLNPATGHIDANKVAAMMRAGKPIGGEMRLPGEFAMLAPRSMRPVDAIGAVMEPSISDGYGPAAMARAAAKPLLKMGAIKAPAPVVARPGSLQVTIDQILNNQFGALPMFAPQASKE